MSYAVVNPATGQSVASYPTISDADLKAAVDKAAAAHDGWSRSSSVADRAALIQKVADLHTERRQELAEIIVREMGKPIQQALAEVDFAAAIYEYYATHGPEFLKDEPIELLAGRRVGVHPPQLARRAARHHALELPVLPGRPVRRPEPDHRQHDHPQARVAVPGVGGGDPEDLPRRRLPRGRVRQRLRLDQPDRVGHRRPARAGRLAHRVRSRPVPRSRRSRASTSRRSCSSSAGPTRSSCSAPTLDAAVEAAVVARLDNSGQSCNGAKRFIVIDSLYDQFLEKFTAGLTAAAPGDPTSADTVLGPLSSLAAAERLQSQLDRAVEQGATLVAGGARDGAYFPAAVLTDVKPGMDAYHQEFFGPVAAVYKVANEDEAVALANDTPFGLGSYLYTTDDEQALRVADKIDAGMVFVNIVGADGAELPFGGVKRSGSGRELGRFGADEFVNKKMIRIGG